MRLTWNNALNDLCQDYMDSLEQKLKANRLPAEIRRLIESFFNYIDKEKNETNFFEKDFWAYVLHHDIRNVDTLFEGELKAVPQFLLGDKWTELWNLYMKAESKSPYTVGYSRRSVRSNLVGPHVRNIASALRDFVILRATGFSSMDIINEGRTPEERKEFRYSFPVTPWLTAMIMAGDKTFIDYLVETMTSENNALRLTYEFLRAIVKSSNMELVKLEGKLLLAARLQEGLRQSILETMDEGTPESYIYLLNIIRDNGLQRYAAVKRGLAVTTGLGETEAPDRITDKFSSIISLYLEHPDEAREAIAGKDAMKVYLALWSMAFFNVESIVNPIWELIATAPSYKVDAAMLVLYTLQLPSLSSRLVSEAIRLRHAEHDIMAGALPLYLNSSDFYYNWDYYAPQLESFFNSREDAIRDFEILVGLIESMRGTETFEPYVFPWMQMSLSRGEVADKLIKIALLLNSDEYLDKVIDYVGYMEPYNRAWAIRSILHNPSSAKQIRFAVECMADRGEDARKEACEAVEKLHKGGRLSDEEYQKMEDMLRLKAANMRICVIGILSSLPDSKALATVERLLKDKLADRRLAALNIIKMWIEDGRNIALAETLIPTLKDIKRATSKEKVLIDSIIDSIDKTEGKYNEANGYGLYNPADEIQVKVKKTEGFNIGKALSFPNKDDAQDIVLKIMKLIEENADYEFEDTYGELLRMGNSPKVNRHRNSLDALAKPEMWKEFYEQEIGSPTNLLRLDLAINKLEDYDFPFFPLFRRLLGSAFHQEDADTKKRRLLDRILGKTKRNADPMAEIKEKPYFNQAIDVCKCLISEYVSSPETWKISADVLSEVAATTKPEELVHKYKAGYGLYQEIKDHSILEIWPFFRMKRMLQWSALICDEDLFAKSFSARYALYKAMDYKKDFNPIDPEEYLRLWNLGWIEDDEFWHEMLGRDASSEMVAHMTSILPEAPEYMKRQRNLRSVSPEDYGILKWQGDLGSVTPEECDLIRKGIDRILEMELQRGDTPTPVTKLAQEIRVVAGVDYLIRILTGMGQEKPKGNVWWLGDSKRDTFTWLLHVSCPAADDTAERLMEKARDAGISSERLVEAAMYSPRWLPLVEKAIGWDGLESAAYYFMAHTGEHLTDAERTRISRYTAVDAADFADGAFDPVWFHEVYDMLGRKRYDVVYEAAKYISEGNRHTRARKLSDAALGILNAKEVQKEIEEKRNKDLVVAYGIIPLGRNKIKDLQQRYAFLNQFLKESKQFGSQRQASEGRAVKLAFDNLARTAGYGDSTRLTWSMEANLVKEVAEYLKPHEVDGASVFINLEDGVPEIIVESKGKRLQSIPARLKKDKYVVRLREVYKQLKDQHVRGRALLESAMVDTSTFTGAEISQLKANPIIWSMFSRLVLVKHDSVFGFPGEDGASLISADGEVAEILPEDHLRIAHPYDLYSAGVWSEYQSAMFDRRWRQPFKQVFRELYVPTKDELETSRSMRYAGNQIMPGRAVGVLKKRQWTVDYEEGLEKVCFNGNVRAVMYALADWFSPSDIEAPTLEYVVFYDRRSQKEKKIKDIDPIVFSEIMRDVDLAVSIAHAGGVDPETSHSTIEMRRAIVEHAMPMFGLSSVEVSGNFAKVKDKLGNYNIHLGSGVIHKEGGAQIAVLPVHSQGRGRIFMPFLDEDPKTAEIISKILLFANDTKIKDPSILEQIR